MKKKFSCPALFIRLALLALCVPLPAALGAVQAAPSPAYTLQLMTILDEPTAEAELQKIRMRGHEAYIVPYTTQTGKVIYKLRSGHYESRAAAAAAADSYAVQEGASVLVVENSGEAAPNAGAVQEKAKVRVTVQNSGDAGPVLTLQQKVSALKRGELLPAKKTKASPGQDDIWFTIQTSTELEKRAAERRINMLRDKGYDAYCAEFVHDGRKLYKIRFGRYGSSQEAERAADNYNISERRKCLVIKIAGQEDADPPARSAAASKKKARASVTAEKEPPQQSAALQPVAQEPEGPAAEPVASRPPPVAEAAPAEPDRELPRDALQPELEPEQERSPENDLASAAPEDYAPEGSPPEKTTQQKAPLARLTTIYAYRSSSGALNLTNRYEDIPEPLRPNIAYISLFPVRITDIDDGLLTLEAGAESRRIKLAGLSLNSREEPARAYLEALKDKPLRLKYNPWMSAKGGAIAGRLYQKDGSYINLDMVSRGLGRYDQATLEPNQQEKFRRAEDAAKGRREGIWQ